MRKGIIDNLQGNTNENGQPYIPLRGSAETVGGSLIAAIANDWVICGSTIHSRLNVQSVQHESINYRYECCFM